MLIFNTTYVTSPSSEKEFLQWVKSEYIPTALNAKYLSRPQLTRVMNNDAEADGISYSLQFHVESLDSLQLWYDAIGATLDSKHKQLFGDKVLGFITLMEVQEL